MIIDGEKYACEACVRGHRVSNCQHSDRPLQHINKKGRPVSQCQHCRAMRKSRASHVKCDCGEKTHKCIHLKTTVEGHKDSCCCNHGGRCTCSHKKEPPQLDTVPESDSEREESHRSKGTKGTSRSRRRANTTSAEGLLAFDSNGHHKPTYKHAKVSQKCGPYQLNRVNSLQSSSGMGNRSMDNLLQGTGTDSRGNRSPSSTGACGSSSQSQRQVRSEAASPLMTGSSSSFAQLNGQLPPLDLSAIKYPAYVPNSADFFGNLSDHEQPMFSAGLSATSVDWSHYDGLDFAGKTSDFAPSNYSQPQSYSGYDYTGSDQVPTLTTNTSTSGEVSEAEDLLPNPLDDFEASFHNGTGGGFGMVLGNPELSGLDFDDYRFIKEENKYLPTPSSLAGDESTLIASSGGYSGYPTIEDDSAFWMNDYSGLPNIADSPTEGHLGPYWETQ